MVLDQQEQSEKLIEEFGRQILVPGVNEEGQLNISKKKICIIGLGALGTVASQYLVRAGVGEIHLIDYDIIEKSNLHRQINYDKDDVGKSKSNTSKHKLKNINDSTIIKEHSLNFESFIKKNPNNNFDLIVRIIIRIKFFLQNILKQIKSHLYPYQLTLQRAYTLHKIVKKIIHYVLSVYFLKLIRITVVLTAQ